jgi:hypothetical protein
LPGVLGEAFDLLSGKLDQFDHEVALAHAAHHPRTGRGLRPDVVLIDECDVPDATIDEAECGSRTQPSGTNDNHFGLPNHRESFPPSVQPSLLALPFIARLAIFPPGRPVTYIHMFLC